MFYTTWHTKIAVYARYCKHCWWSHLYWYIN